jgi:hypothetical protein
MSRSFLVGFAAIAVVLSMMRPVPAPSLKWWTTHSLEKVRPFQLEPEGADHIVRIHAARNEFEPFQVVLRPEGQDIDAIDVEVTDLRGPSSAISSEKYITVYFEKFLDLTVPSSVDGGTGEWPDPLIPRVDRFANEKRNAFPFKLTAGRTQPIWIDVYVPPSMPPGIYQGYVRILSDGKIRFAIPVELEVWNFELPSTPSLPTAFGFSGKAALKAHLGKYTSDEDVVAITRQYQKSAFWHRITLDPSASVAPVVRANNGNVRIDWTRYDNAMGPFMEGTAFKPGEPLYRERATSIVLHTPPNLSTDDQTIEFWRQAAAHFRQKGWFERLFNYVWDEPGTRDFAAMARLGRLAHVADPKLKNLVTAPLHPEWSDFINIWSPGINCFESKPHHVDFCDPMADRAAYAPELAKGKLLWWYQACGSHGCNIVGGDYFRGWPDYMIDDAAVRNRIMEWLTWKYGMQGELYFSTDEAFSRKQDPWTNVNLFGGNGDGTLFYPGRPDVIAGTTHVPIESIRLKLIREGLEDYEYLSILTKLTDFKTVADHVNTFIRRTYDFDQDSRSLYAVREWMGREINQRSNR